MVKSIGKIQKSSLKIIESKNDTDTEIIISTWKRKPLKGNKIILINQQEEKKWFICGKNPDDELVSGMVGGFSDLNDLIISDEIDKVSRRVILAACEEYLKYFYEYSDERGFVLITLIRQANVDASSASHILEIASRYLDEDSCIGYLLRKYIKNCLQKTSFGGLKNGSFAVFPTNDKGEYTKTHKRRDLFFDVFGLSGARGDTLVRRKKSWRDLKITRKFAGALLAGKKKKDIAITLYEKIYNKKNKGDAYKEIYKIVKKNIDIMKQEALKCFECYVCENRILHPNYKQLKKMGVIDKLLPFADKLDDQVQIQEVVCILDNVVESLSNKTIKNKIFVNLSFLRNRLRELEIYQKHYPE